MCYIEQNRVRAKHVQLVAVMLYDDVGRDDDSAMVDMLKDIMHACKQVGLPFDQMLHCADKQFQCEVEDNTQVWCDETGPKFTAMDIARNIAVLESEGIVHTAMKSLLDAAWTQINDLCSETRAILLDEANGYKGSDASECPYWSGSSDLSPKFPPALGGVLGVKSLALSRHLVHCLSLQKFHRCQVAQC